MVLYPGGGTTQQKKKERKPLTCPWWVSLKCTKPVSQVYVRSDSFQTTFWKRQNDRNRRQIELPGAGPGEELAAKAQREGLLGMMGLIPDRGGSGWATACTCHKLHTQNSELENSIYKNTK